MISAAVLLGGTCSILALIFSDLLLSTILAGMSWGDLAVTVASIPFAFLTLFLITFLTGAGHALLAVRVQLATGVAGTAILVVALGCPFGGGVPGDRPRRFFYERPDGSRQSPGDPRQGGTA